MPTTRISLRTAIRASVHRRAARRTLALPIVAVLLVSACGTSGTTPTPSAVRASSTVPGDVLSKVPPETRVTNGGTDPRTAAYWVTWSTCGKGSQAAVAAANGGRAAGWILLDDLLTDPGVQLGAHPVTTCREAVDILESNQFVQDDISRLAAGSITAELNLSAGAETCTAIEGVVRVARVKLESAGYGGPGQYDKAAAEAPDLIRETIALLDAYNLGVLCRPG